MPIFLPRIRTGTLTLTFLLTVMALESPTFTLRMTSFSLIVVFHSKTGICTTVRRYITFLSEWPMTFRWRTGG